jgi:nanoRNase/pAp phosphatase (c-di-AMP/oligoRNAs hydrolase)
MRRALLLTHDNPDPDSLASAWALGQLLEERAGMEVTLAYGGLIGRAENRAMVRFLRIPATPIHRVSFSEYDVLGLVDTQPEVQNHSLPEVDKPVICIDHHPEREESVRTAFSDVGGDAGATSTLLVNYLRAAGVTTKPAVATALFYGIKSDTRDLGREVSPLDVEAYRYLIPLTDMPLISAIEHPQLPREYFGVLVSALRRVRLHGNIAVVDLGGVYVPELVPEMADRLMSIDGVKWGLAAGDHEAQLYISVRVNDKRMRSHTMLRERVEPLKAGGAGGHGSMAGARVDLSLLAPNQAGRNRKRKKLIKDLIADMGGPREGEPLLAPRRRTPQ